MQRWVLNTETPILPSESFPSYGNHPFELFSTKKLSVWLDFFHDNPKRPKTQRYMDTRHASF